MIRHRLIAIALAVAWRNLHNYFRNPSLFLPGLLFPLFFFAAFAGGLSRIEDVPAFDFPTGYTSFQYVFVLLQSAAFGGVFTGLSIARDFESGFARRLLLAATRRPGILAGYTMAALGRWAFTASVVTVVAVAVGMEVGGTGVDLFGLFVIALLVNLLGALWAAGIAMRFRTIQSGPLMQVPVFILLFLAPVYVPTALLAGWIEAVAQVNPVTYLLEAGRGFISGEPTRVGLAYGLGLVLAAILLLWALRGLRKAESAG